MDVAAVITAASVLLTALLSGIVVIIREVRQARTEAKADVADVHKIVNQQRTDMLAEIKALKKMVRRRGGNPEDVRPKTDEGEAA